MADTKTKPQGRAPWLAVFIGTLSLGGGANLILDLLAGRVRAFAFSVDGSFEELLLPLVGAVLLVTMITWGAIQAYFKAYWQKNRGQLYLALLVLLGASTGTSTFQLTRKVENLRHEAAVQAEYAVAKEDLALAKAQIGFSNPDDAALIADAMREMRGWADPIDAVREVKVSRDPRGRWDAVCGRVSFKTGKWAGFVSRREADGRRRAMLQQDGFDEQKSKTCKPIVDKYVGVDGVDVAKAAAAIQQLGCVGLDIYYWEAEKAYCHGRIVEPKL